MVLRDLQFVKYIVHHVMDPTHILSTADVIFLKKKENHFLSQQILMRRRSYFFLSSSSLCCVVWALKNRFISLQNPKIHFMETDMLRAMIFLRGCCLILQETSLEYKERWDCDNFSAHSVRTRLRPRGALGELLLCVSLPKFPMAH